MKTLLLNQSYQPINIINWQKGFILAYLDKAEIVETYEDIIKSPNQNYKVPSVIRLKEKTPFMFRKARFSKKAILIRDNYTCQYCFRQLPKSKLTLDHIIPKSKGGKTTWTNIVTCCRDCNHYKSDLTLEQAGMSLKTKPTVPQDWQIKKKLSLQSWLKWFAE